jgi:predicted N-acetyltransferase YhbS
MLECRLMTDEFRLARADELDAAFAVSALAFQRGTVADWAAGLDRDPWRDAGENLVAVADGRVVASLRVCARRIAGPAGDLRLAGIANVASHPSIRRQGYIHRLLSLAHQRSSAAGYDLAMLFTGVPYVYSGGAAFETLPFWWLDIPLEGLAHPDDAWRVEPLDISRHLGEMREVYDAFGRDRPGYPLRDDAFWAHPARRVEAEWTRVALNPSGRVVAYGRVRVGAADGQVRLGELPYLEADAARAIYADFERDPAVAACTTLGGRMPRDHALGTLPGASWRTYLDSMGHGYTPEGAALLTLLREGPPERAVYWTSDGF